MAVKITQVNWPSLDKLVSHHQNPLSEQADEQADEQPDEVATS